MLRLRAALLCAVVLALAFVTVPASAQPTRFSAAQLENARGLVNARLIGSPNGVTGWGVDPATNRMVVSVLAGDSAALAAARRAVAGFPEASLQTVSERPRPFYDLVGGQTINGGGSWCSAGFSARAGANAYLITAGHCTNLGGTWSGYNRVAIGPVDRSSFPGNDFGTVRVTSASWTPTAKVQQASSSSTVSIAGSTEAAVGASVCRTGSTTGYRCGVIQAKNQTVTYSTGRVSGLTRTSVCAEGGDSGGSFFSGNQAQGLTSGGSGNCSSGGTTYFQPINEVLSSYGVRLVTTNSQPANPVFTLCSDWKYSGTCAQVTLDTANLSTLAVGDNRLSSIRVPSGWYLLLYADANYSGTCQAFSGDVEFLQNTRIGNDTTSSYRIAATSAGCPTS